MSETDGMNLLYVLALSSLFPTINSPGCARKASRSQENDSKDNFPRARQRSRSPDSKVSFTQPLIRSDTTERHQTCPIEMLIWKSPHVNVEHGKLKVIKSCRAGKFFFHSHAAIPCRHEAPFISATTKLKAALFSLNSFSF